MRKMNATETRVIKHELTEVSFRHGFSDRMLQDELRVVSRISPNGFTVTGWNQVGVEFIRGEGVYLWNKAQRNAGKKIPLSDLVALEVELSEVFEAMLPEDMK